MGPNSLMRLDRRAAALGMGAVLMSAMEAHGNGIDRAPPMLLAGKDSWFRLTIADYQFPENTQDDWDSNWLVIDGAVRLTGRDWRFRDPCLTTFEVLRLANWFDACAEGKPHKPYCGFTEPNLQFDLVDARTIRVSFALESAPPWAKPRNDWTKYGFNFPIGPDLVKAASDLRHQLERFPVRGAEFKAK